MFALFSLLFAVTQNLGRSPAWEILPKRWIVERSLAWLNNSRRLSKDYEISVRSAQAVCLIAASRTLLKRFSLLVQLLKKH